MFTVFIVIFLIGIVASLAAVTKPKKPILARVLVFVGMTFASFSCAVGITILIFLGLWFGDDGGLSKISTEKAPMPNVKFDNFEPKLETVKPDCGTFPKGNCDPVYHEFKEQYKIEVKKDCSDDECSFEFKGEYPKNMKLYAADDDRWKDCSFVNEEFLAQLGDKNTDSEFVSLSQKDGKFETEIKLKKGKYDLYNVERLCFVARPQNQNEKIIKGVLVEVSSDFKANE